ncbi:unnamed protein product [Vicia faba]|uniref:Replication protein A 70 kDa DNA-binding subunit B/D first OB fold domain-containing protein n=1 Tax=Vicia faba TaxID=3906 RepID=A0AAV1AC58_VICFA|nr:unnamed protein product [Vicia faba]
MEMVLMDDKGDKIQVSVRKVLLPRFENKNKEGSSYNFKSFGVVANTGAFRTTKHQFKLNFHNGTIITYVGTGMTTLSPYSFVSFTYIFGKIDMDYLIDVISILSSVGRERVYERNRVATKFKFIELESNGIKLECTLFGSYVEAFDAFLQFGSYVEAFDAFLQFGCNGNVIVISQYLKVKIYMKDTSEMSLEEDFLKLSRRKTIEELKDCQDNIFCIMLGTMKHVISGNNWWYAACVYNKGVVTDSKGFSALSAKSMFGKLCQGTIKHVIGGNDWWYVACVYNKGVITDSKRIFCTKCEKHVWTIVPRVIDETDSTTFVVFDRDCYLLKKMYADLIDQMDCILGCCCVVHNDIDPVVVQDLGNKFDNIAAEEKCGDNDEVADENDGASSRITKNIKIEKE